MLHVVNARCGEGLSVGISWDSLVVSQCVFLYLSEHNNADPDSLLKDLSKISLQRSTVCLRMTRDGQGRVEFRE